MAHVACIQIGHSVFFNATIIISNDYIKIWDTKVKKNQKTVMLIWKKNS